MARNSAVSLSAVNGITRTFDYSFDLLSIGGVLGGGFPSGARNNKSGVLITGALTTSGAVVSNPGGKMGLGVNSGLNNGVLWGLMGMPINTVTPTIAGSITIAPAVTRFMTGLSATSMVTPNSDVGIECIIAASLSAFTDLTTIPLNSTGQGTSGFGIMMKGNVWTWVIKKQNTALGIFQEAVALTWPAAAVADPTIPVDVEFRIFDAIFGTPARVEVYVANVLALTRYWTNPTGVVTTTLPPFFTTLSGGQLYLLHRNTSTGPTQVMYADTRIIAGPNDAGTVP